MFFLFFVFFQGDGGEGFNLDETGRTSASHSGDRKRNEGHPLLRYAMCVDTMFYLFIYVCLFCSVV